ALPTTTQARRGSFAPWRSSRMLLYPRMAAAVLVTVIAVGGAMYLLGQRNPIGVPEPTASPPAATPTAAAVAPTASPPPDTTFWVKFTSPFYGYVMSRPLDWTEQPATTHWAFATQADTASDNLW